MIVEFLGTLDQPYTTRMDGRYRSLSPVGREIRWCSRECMWVSSYCSCDAQIQASNLLCTEIVAHQKQEEGATTNTSEITILSHQ
mgnify:CR=1 FL=1